MDLATGLGRVVIDAADRAVTAFGACNGSEGHFRRDSGADQDDVLGLNRLTLKSGPNRYGSYDGYDVIEIRVSPPATQQGALGEDAQADGDQNWRRQEEERTIRKEEIEAEQPCRNERAENQQRLRNAREPSPILQDSAGPRRFSASVQDGER